ncbi:MAG: hypothetical protein H6557_21260 [Lewinellaceae bacterium]|nr:hypothetical protein [Phaeodactylibacter sp.]MCB9039148.1 hypothetical protein [Lewinellaceae bacterium]
MKEAVSFIAFLSGLVLIITGVALYWTEGALSAGKLSVASGVWLQLFWASTLQEKSLSNP